jgi:DNA sulfur modification protein DndC
MSSRQQTLFDGSRLQMDDSIRLTVESLLTYGPRHEHWAIAWSGGKDSTTLVTLIIYLIISGKVPPPRTLTVLYADTRMELLPLWFAAAAIRDELAEHAAALAELGCVLDVRTVVAPLDDRFFVYMLGRGVPPSNNRTFRWCTPQIKVEPMEAELRRLAAERAQEGHAKILMLTGVRVGESAVRDERIALACSRDDSECGQGWYQETLPTALCDTLAPILHWRVCHIWEWLRHWATQVEFGDFSTEVLADAYGGDEAEELHARTGCVGCPLAERDTALDYVISTDRWSYLAPLKRLRPIYRELREPRHRLRKLGVELLADGSIGKNPQRMGPLLLETRLWALEQVLAIQAEVNTAARALGRPLLDLLNAEEEARIRELIAANTWPEKWTGDEPHADELLDKVFQDGTVQPLLPGLIK